MMKLIVGDHIIGTSKNLAGIERVITAARATGYSWKYPYSDEEFDSESSCDPFFELHWDKVEKASCTTS